MQRTGRDLWIEADHASAVVTWAAALRAIVVPHHHKEYSEIGLTMASVKMLTTFGSCHAPWLNAPKVGYQCSSVGDPRLAQELWESAEAIRVRGEFAAALEGGAFDAAPLGVALQDWTQAVRAAAGTGIEQFAVGAPLPSGSGSKVAPMRWMRDLLAGGMPDIREATGATGEESKETNPCSPLLVLAPDLSYLGEGSASEAGSGDGV